MSPEQVEGKPADNRADLYAYGLILYEMVTGDVPFTGESTLKVMYQRIQEKPKSPKLIKPDLPNWLVRIIMRCLERSPDDRYQNAYEILADLQGSLSGAGSSRAGISRIGSGSQSVVIQIPEFASHRWVWIVAGTVVLLAILFAIPPIRHLIPGFRVEQTGRRHVRNPAALERQLCSSAAAASSRRSIATRLHRPGHRGSYLREAISIERRSRYVFGRRQQS